MLDIDKEKLNTAAENHGWLSVGIDKEEKPFTSPDNITVMAVDTCPNALAMDASKYFGDMLIEYVFRPLLSGKNEKYGVIHGATIVNKGKLTEKYAYLKEFSEGC